jgi:hypothetical protein
MKNLEKIKNLIDTKQLFVGITRQGLISLLGYPSKVVTLNPKFPLPNLWFYEEVEFSFPTGKSSNDFQHHGLNYIFYKNEFLLMLERVDGR